MQNFKKNLPHAIPYTTDPIQTILELKLFPHVTANT
jgi:hypothetical protein